MHIYTLIITANISREARKKMTKIELISRIEHFSLEYAGKVADRYEMICDRDRDIVVYTLRKKEGNMSNINPAGGWISAIR